MNAELSEAERAKYGIRDRDQSGYPTADLLFYEEDVERILAARTAVLQAEVEASEGRNVKLAEVVREHYARAEAAEAEVAELRAKVERVEVLAFCDLPHGADGNAAEVYGHHGSRRTCLRIKATNEWVYDPAWEA